MPLRVADRPVPEPVGIRRSGTVLGGEGHSSTPAGGSAAPIGPRLPSAGTASATEAALAARAVAPAAGTREARGFRDGGALPVQRAAAAPPPPAVAQAPATPPVLEPEASPAGGGAVEPAGPAAAGGTSFRENLLAHLSDASVVGELGRALRVPSARAEDRTARTDDLTERLSDPVVASELARVLLDPLLRLLENHLYKERDRRSLLIDGHLH